MTNEIFTNKILNDAQLENISGGNRDELALDRQLFNTMGDRIELYDLDNITNKNVRGIAAKINSLYGKLGIQVKYNDFGASSYSINGNPIS